MAQSKAVTRRWVNRERGRYYIVVVTDDLFGGWNLQRFWGGCDSRRGGCLTQHLEDSEAIEDQMRRIAARRQKRDYSDGTPPASRGDAQGKRSVGGAVPSVLRRLAQHLKRRMPRADRDDLEQAGMVGLIEGASRFCSGSGATFKTFIGHRVRGAMLDSVREGGWAPRSVTRAALAGLLPAGR